MTDSPLDRLSRTLARSTTRRGSVAFLTALGLATLPEASDARSDKRRRKKKRKRHARPDSDPDRCLRERAACSTFEVCCSRTCDFLVDGGSCAPCRGRTCSIDRPCCGGLDCLTGYCDGCRDRATSCTANSQCCFSDCANGACLSKRGGRCARDVDCRSCYLNRLCTNACVNGICAV